MLASHNDFERKQARLEGRQRSSSEPYDVSCTVQLWSRLHELWSFRPFVQRPGKALATDTLPTDMCTLQGPNLGGIFGRTSGTAAGFSYSAANKDAAITWGEPTLYDYLLNPKKYIPGASLNCLDCLNYQYHTGKALTDSCVTEYLEVCQEPQPPAWRAHREAVAPVAPLPIALTTPPLL